MIRQNNFVSLTAALLLVSVMAGCGTSATPSSELVVRSLAGTKTSAVKSVAKTAAVAPTVSSAALVKIPAAAAATAIQMSSVAKAGAGTVSVSFAGLVGTAARHLDDVDGVHSVTATLTASNGTVQTIQLNASQLASNPTASFTGVPVGTATLSVIAYDASGAQIGSGSSSTTVTAGATAQVALSVGLSNGTTTASTGSVAATVTFVNGTTATPSPIVAAAGTDVWGRLYDYNGNQLTSGTVTYTSADGTYSQTAALRTDGYYYMPAVPQNVTINVSATSGSLVNNSTTTVSDPNNQGYDWIDLFVQ